MHYFTDVTRADLEEKLGLDVPVHVQYVRWLKNLVLHRTLGDSLWQQTSVVDEVIIRVPVTLELGILGLLVSLLIGVPIGIYSAMRQDTIGDHIARSIAIIFISVPGFWLGTMVVRHALKNALIPVVGLVGLMVSVMIGGSVVIEEIFSLPGMGRLTLNVVSQRDYTVVSGVLLFFGTGMILVNLVIDLLYAYLDPRIRYD